MITLVRQLVLAQRDRLAYVSVGLVQRILPFLLLPVFVRFLTPAEYGHVAILTASFTLASMVFGLGQEVVEYRYHFDRTDAGPSMESAAVRVHLFAPIMLALPMAGLLMLSGATPAGVPTLAVSGSMVAGAVHASAWRFPAVQFRCEGQLGRYAAAGAGFVAVSSGSRLHSSWVPVGEPSHGRWVTSLPLCCCWLPRDDYCCGSPDALRCGATTSGPR